MSKKFSVEEIVIDGYYFINHEGLYWHSGQFWYNEEQLKKVNNNGSLSILLHSSKLGVYNIAIYTLKLKIMKKNNIITPANLPEQKMSTLFWSVLEDIKKTIHHGIKINMDSWCNTSRKICTVCLGGAACLGFIADKDINKDVISEVHNVYFGKNKIDGIIFTENQRRNIQHMMDMFNMFRIGNYTTMVYCYNQFSKKGMPNLLSVLDIPKFSGITDVIDLENAIKKFATYLEQHNL